MSLTIDFNFCLDPVGKLLFFGECRAKYEPAFQFLPYGSGEYSAPMPLN
jgi:hypothetical protein